MTATPRLLLLLLALALPCLAVAEPASSPWRFSQVTGAGGVRLNVVQTGAPTGTPIVFVHGVGQSYLAFEPQLRGPRAARHPLVAYDLRGHGNSDKPLTREAYADRQAWADDLRAVIAATTSAPPLLVGWSYGTVVIVDYVRAHGTKQVAGIVLVSSDGGLSPPRPPMTGPIVEMLDAMHRRQEGPDLEGNVAAARELARLLTAKPMPEAWVERAALVSMRVPAPVWGLLRTHPLANQDLVDRLDLPVMLAIGRHDGGTPEDATRAIARAMPDASVSVFEQSGHSPFVEETERFDAMLESFTQRLASRPKAGDVARQREK